VAHLYDLMLLLDPNVPEDRRSAVVDEVESMISAGGEVVASQDWGSRRLAYEIDHRADAGYHLFQFNGENALLERLRHSLRIMDGVLRFRIIRLKAGTPPPEPPREAAARPPREEEGEGRVAARAAADAPADEPAETEDAPA
jgi:small subunit ribosomal protein S6